nr:hypothetical protein [Tanacetum cinerariifolium]
MSSDTKLLKDEECESVDSTKYQGMTDRLEAAATDVVASPTTTINPNIETDPEAKPSEPLPSPDYVPSSPIYALASPDYHPVLDIESEPFKDEPKPIEDAPKPLPTQVAPPPPVCSIPTLPTSFVEPTPAPPIIPHDTRATARMTDSVSLSRSSSATPLVSRSGPSRRRSHPISSTSSSGTSPAPSGPLPCKRHPVSSYSIPLASARPSRKRCRSPTTSLLATASAPAILSSVPVARLPRRNRLRGLTNVSYHDVMIKAVAEPVSPPAHYGPMIKEILDEHSEVIGDMYEHLLEIPLPRIEEIDEVSFYTLFRAILPLKSCNYAQIMYLIVPFYVFSTWMAFRGNTHDLRPLGEETDKTMSLHS